jgi:hypothetical protein
VSLIGREVILGFDSDAHRKVGIRRSLKELAEYLEGRGAR